MLRLGTSQGDIPLDPLPVHPEREPPAKGDPNMADHNGTPVTVWLAPDQYDRLVVLAAAAKTNRSTIIRRLSMSQRLPDPAYLAYCSDLGRIGGMIKHYIQAGDIPQAYKLGQQAVNMARQFRLMYEHTHNNY